MNTCLLLRLRRLQQMQDSKDQHTPDLIWCDTASEQKSDKNSAAKILQPRE